MREKRCRGEGERLPAVVHYTRVEFHQNWLPHFKDIREDVQHYRASTAPLVGTVQIDAQLRTPISLIFFTRFSLIMESVFTWTLSICTLSFILIRLCIYQMALRVMRQFQHFHHPKTSANLGGPKLGSPCSDWSQILALGPCGCPLGIHGLAKLARIFVAYLVCTSIEK